MHALFETYGNRTLALDMTLEDFVHSGPMFQQAQAALCEPEELLLDHVGEIETNDDDELLQAFAEAAMVASDFAVHNVALDPADLLFIKRQLCRNRGLKLIDTGYPPLVA